MTPLRSRARRWMKKRANSPASKAATTSRTHRRLIVSRCGAPGPPLLLSLSRLFSLSLSFSAVGRWEPRWTGRRRRSDGSIRGAPQIKARGVGWGGVGGRRRGLRSCHDSLDPLRDWWPEKRGAARRYAVPPRGRLRLQSASMIIRLDVLAGVMDAEWLLTRIDMQAKELVRVSVWMPHNAGGKAEVQRWPQTEREWDRKRKRTHTLMVGVICHFHTVWFSFTNCRRQNKCFQLGFQTHLQKSFFFIFKWVFFSHPNSLADII